MNVLLIVSPTLLALTDYVLVQKVMQVGKHSEDRVCLL